MTDTPDEELSTGEALLLARLSASLSGSEQITLMLGSGLTASVVPRATGLLEIADQYAAGRNDEGALQRALAQARAMAGTNEPVDVYRAYRRVFADWVSGGAFDVIAQQAVLKAYTPDDPMESPLATRGLGQRIERGVGEALENERYGWQLPRGVQALGHLLAQAAVAFDNRVLTTNFDPLIELAVRAANGLAVSLPLDLSGGYGTSAGADGAIRVFHLHGFWRPTLHVRGPRLLHDPARLAEAAEMAEGVAGLIRGDTICVLGSGDWAGTLASAIAVVARRRRVRVLWGLNDADPEEALRVGARLKVRTGTDVECFPGIDTDRFFPALADLAGVIVPPRAPGRRHMTRHHKWERQLVTQPDSAPPADVNGLLLQLERRFGWVNQAQGARRPSRVLWPVRLRPRASVIHMVQAFTAGALARLGVEVRMVLDDVGTRTAESADSFRADLVRWIGRTAQGAPVRFVSLAEFVDQSQRLPRTPSPESLLRPTDPWGVARRIFYSDRNPSLYSMLAAVKAVPHLADWDALEANAWPIVQAMVRTDASRLLIPLTLWPYLNSMLLESPTGDVLTLGGRDEALLWAQWRQTFGFGPGHLYNPYIKNLKHDAHMLSWSTRDELREHLYRTRELHAWDAEGSYVPWLFHNAMLLPAYLTADAVPEVDEFPLDSWAAFVAAIEMGRPALDVLADRVNDLYLAPLAAES